MTGFFHVPSAFGVLEEKVIPALFEGKSSKDHIRVWVAGCATGEEAYSVAILLFEYASTLNAPPTIEVYATDNDKEALQKAEVGSYPKSIAGEMSSVCLSRYFVEEEFNFTIIPEVKASVHFSTHDVLIDNSFQSFELITCRHLLAYLDKTSQSQIVSFFHHSLRPGGFLFLGDAEFAESLPGHFASVDNVFKIYQLLDADFNIGVDDIPARVPEEFEEAAHEPPTISIPENGHVQAEELKDERKAASLFRVKPDDPPAFSLAVEELPPSEAPEILPEALEEERGKEGKAEEGDDTVPKVHQSLIGQIAARANENKSDEKQLFGAKDPSVEKPFGREPKDEELDLSSFLASAEALFREESGFREEVGDGMLSEPESEPSKPAPVPKQSRAILTQLHREHLLQHYVPASILIDRDLNILDHTGTLDRFFAIKTGKLADDYLKHIPDGKGGVIKEAVNQLFFEATAGKIYPLKVPSIDNKQQNFLEMEYLDSPDPSLEIAQIVFKTPLHKGSDSATEQKSFFATHIEEAKHLNGEHQGSIPGALLEDNFLKMIGVAPFPMLAHAEGGRIVAMSPSWEDLAGIKKGEAQTISAWTKMVRGQRLQLKDSRLKESYADRGVVCISIRAQSGDTKLLAFHSSFLGRTTKGQKLTLTMAVDITNYPGHAGMGISPENADFGVAAKKVFLANMSHEIRTPLTSMIGFADYLSDKLTGQDVQFAQYISDSGNRLLETLNAVLRIASIDGAEPLMRPEVLDITAEAQGVVQMFKPHAEQYSIPLKLIVEQPAKAKLDRAAFRRVLTNLVGNAIKFTPDGEVTITVNGDHESVIVEIEDTGVGVSEEFLPHVFDRFAQESKGQARAYSGCGLGLSICKELVEIMGGTIQIESELGLGSKFIVSLPKEPAGDEHASAGGDARNSDLEAHAEAKQRILVVEDNADTQELMLLILRDKYDVSITSNASETLELVNKESFEVILMDLNLGGRRTGFELLREVRQIKDFESTPVLAVSALPIGVIRKQLIREGFNGYIAKPFTRARIIDALDGVLNLVP